MQNKGTLTRILAAVGTALAWFPLLAPLLLAAIAPLSGRRARLDYLMPAELFPVALTGGVLLLWAALRARSRLRPIAWGLVAAIGLLIGSQALAVVTGLASGAREAEGWPWILVVALLAGFILALVVVAIAGVLLLRDLWRRAA